MYRGRLQDRKVDEAHLQRILEAAGWAPSGHNSQPWEFLVIDKPETIVGVAEIASKAFDTFLATSPDLRDWVANWCRWLRWSREELNVRGDGIFFQRMSRSEWEELERLSSDEEIRERLLQIFGSGGQPSILITTAPCLIYTLVNSKRQMPDFSSDMIALTSAGAAMQNLRLAAYDLGLATHEQSPLYDLPEVREAVSALLGIPKHCHLVGGMRLGYPTGPVKSSDTHKRRPIEQLLHRNRYSGCSKPLTVG